jgi:glycosyltransferase involved in cell wall biosynthesis
MIGAFPPPVHGMANVNKAMHDLLALQPEELKVIDISASTLNRSVSTRLKRSYKVLTGILKLLWYGKPHKTTIYMSLSGGIGQLYETLYILVCRLLSLNIFLHHHSFAYLTDQPSTITSLLTRIAGKNAHHVCLSPMMATRLRALYPTASSTITLSNVAFLKAHAGSSPNKHLSAIGYLSNISKEKGVFHFLELCKVLNQAEPSVNCILSGPFQDDETEVAVKALLTDLPNTTYIGAVYNDEKDAFFSSIDALIFPTIYANEAEPLTVLEAMARCIPVIAYGRGAIPEIVQPPFGCSIDVEVPFTTPAFEQILFWQQNPAQYQEASVQAGKHFTALKSRNRAALHELVSAIAQLQ